MTAEIIRWCLLIFLLVLIVFHLSGISATLRTIRHAIVILLVHISHPEIFKDVDLKEVMDDDDD